MRTANPALNASIYDRLEVAEPRSVMTVQGSINKTALLLALVVAGAVWTWRLAAPTTGAVNAAVVPWMLGGLVGGLILALITIFKPTVAPYTSPVYAACEGLLLGALSAFAEAQFPGIVIQAVGLTFGTLFVMLMAYTTGVVRATERFKAGVIAATGAICLIYLVTLVLGLFSIQVPFIHDSGWIGIGFSLFVVVIAALNLVLDFDFIERGAERGAPKYMEWYAAFGLLVTLVWLYIEILRLLSKLNRR